MGEKLNAPPPPRLLCGGEMKISDSRVAINKFFNFVGCIHRSKFKKLRERMDILLKMKEFRKPFTLSPCDDFPILA
jgi:hypothetical protein